MRVLILLFWIALCQFVGLMGARWTAPEIPAWYRNLAKPRFNPPGWVFAPVWTILYLLMAIAVWRVEQVPPSALRNGALCAFVFQLVLNLAWTWIFFRRHAIRAALADIALLWLAILATAILFERIDIPAAALLIPYLLWVGFAATLNGAIVRLN